MSIGYLYAKADPDCSDPEFYWGRRKWGVENVEFCTSKASNGSHVRCKK